MKDNMLSEIYELLASNSEITLRQLIDQKKEEMEISSDRQLSKVVGIDQTTLDRMLKGDTQKVDLFSLIKLDEFLGVGISKLAQVYVSSLKPELIAELERSRKASYIIRTFDLPGLKKVKLIDSTVDFESIDRKLTAFFKLDSIFHYEREVGAALFSSTKRSPHDKMKDFWVRCAFMQFERINNPNSYDRAAVESMVTKIRPYTRYEEKGYLNVLKALYSVGVTVVVQPYLSRTQVRGATFAVKGKPCIVITDFNKSYATIWFALLHELYHVLYDFDDLQKGFKVHLTGEPDINLFREDDADYFAQEILFPQEKLDYIKHLINSPSAVAAYAEQNKVHPSIIYSFFCYEEKKRKGKDLYGIFQKHFGSPDRALEIVRSNPWDKDSIYTEIETIKKKLEIN